MKNNFDIERNEIMTSIINQLSFYENEVLRTGTTEICIPIVNNEGDEGFIVINFKIPKGSRDGEAYDGYAVAEEFAMKQKLKEEKAKELAEKKAKKIAKDKEMREAKAKAKRESA